MINKVQGAGKIIIFQGEVYSIFLSQNKKPGLASPNWIKPRF